MLVFLLWKCPIKMTYHEVSSFVISARYEGGVHGGHVREFYLLAFGNGLRITFFITGVSKPVYSLPLYSSTLMHAWWPHSLPCTPCSPPTCPQTCLTESCTRLSALYHFWSLCQEEFLIFDLNSCWESLTWTLNHYSEIVNNVYKLHIVYFMGYIYQYRSVSHIILPMLKSKGKAHYSLLSVSTLWFFIPCYVCRCTALQRAKNDFNKGWRQQYVHDVLFHWQRLWKGENVLENKLSHYETRKWLYFINKS